MIGLLQDLHLTAHNTHNRQTSVLLARFEPRIPSRRAAANPRLRTRDRMSTHTVSYYSDCKNVHRICNLVFMIKEHTLESHKKSEKGRYHICTKHQTVPSYKCSESFKGIDPMELSTDKKIFKFWDKEKCCIVIVNNFARNQDIIPSQLTQHVLYLYTCISLYFSTLGRWWLNDSRHTLLVLMWTECVY
jgi:hypothetical protein